MQQAPGMCMKIKETMTKCLVNYTPFTRKFAHGATIDKNRLDFFAEMHRSGDESRRSDKGVPPVSVMARMAIARAVAWASRSLCWGRLARARKCSTGILPVPRHGQDGHATNGGTPTQQITVACHYVLEIKWVSHGRGQS